MIKRRDEDKDDSIWSLRSSSLQRPRKRVVLKVGGTLFETWEENLDNYPDTLLGSAEKELFYDRRTKSYVFDRDPQMFRHILNYYRLGKLHFSSEYCADDFRDELSFFRISINAVSNCCWDDYRQPRKIRMDKIFKLKDPHLKEMVDTGCWPRRKIWNILENPSETTLGRAWYYFSGIMIALSIVCTVAESMPLPCDEKYLCANHTCGKNNWNLSLKNKENDSCHEINHYERQRAFIYFVLESICVAIFSLEYLMRFLTTPSRCKYVKEFMSIIDLLSILPYYIGLILESLLQTSVDSLSALVLLRVLRVFRVLKFTRHSDRLRSLLFAIRRSASELGFILFSFSLGVILFSSILFYAEQSDKSNSANLFESIPATMWYAVVTMTTTGYGDMVPHTVIGKLIGSVGCITGVLMIALPVPIIQKKANLQLGLLDEVDEAMEAGL
ncbi:potassium voltage-gated channel protein Shal-like [Acropora muricata]|uniref:potassium voltage-gated channel protein Shal-like n=1 Tax=Acropora millepora TaxID=45264 RepID=UPI001CF47689|nr:potassium voltage-gated channel protein Shal-like [Acropora millepora]